MNAAGRIVMFLVIVLLTWTLMHVFVLTRLWSLPFILDHGLRRALVVAFILLWISFPLAQFLARSGVGGRAVMPLEVFSAFWLGTLFLMFASLLLADVLTGFGFLLPRAAPLFRSVATLVAVGLAVVGLVQGLRPPSVKSYDVAVRDLPRDDNGLVLVQVSDLHLGELLGKRWLENRLAQIEAIRPDAIFVTGDLLNEVELVEPLVPTLRKLKAPLGVYAVTGNHEYYAGLSKSLRLFHEAGFHVLRNEFVQLRPGLVLAGVDDLTASRQYHQPNSAIERALTGRPPGATILLSHTPWAGDLAARLGVGLMLSGHTHGGQIWPFTYLSRIVYPYQVGRYTIGDMTWLVTRGTGFWGPPMRLFSTAEIVRITLRSAN